MPPTRQPTIPDIPAPAGGFVSPNNVPRLRDPNEEQPLTPRGIDERGLPTFDVGRTAFGNIGTRNQLAALSVIDTDGVDPVGFALSSIAGWVGHAQNLDYMQRVDLGISSKNHVGKELYNRDKEEYVPRENIAGRDLLSFVGSGTRRILEERGFDPSVLDADELSENVSRVKRFLLQQRLQDRLSANADSIFESVIGVIGNFGLDLVTDPTTVFSAGTGAVGRKIGTAALRGSARSAARSAARTATARGVTKQVKNQALDATQKFVASSMGRLNRNGTITGSLIDNQFTRSHAGLMQAADTAALVGAFDLLAQKKAHNLQSEISNVDGDWWRPEQTAFSVMVGAGLGGLAGRLFLQGRISANNVRRARLLSADNTTPYWATGGSATPSDPSAGMPRVLLDPNISITREEITDDLADTIIDNHMQAFHNNSRNTIFTAYENASARDGFDKIEFADFMATRPTEDEILKFLNAEPDPQLIGLAKGRRTQAENRYKKRLEKDKEAGVETPPEVHEKHKLEIDLINQQIDDLQNGNRPKQGKIKRLVDSISRTRDEWLDAVDRGADNRTLNEIQDRLFSLSDEIDATVNEITGNLIGKEQQNLIAFAQSLDAPRAGRMTPSQQADAISALANIGDLTFPSNNPNITSKFLNWNGFSFISGIGTGRHDMENAARKSPWLSLVANMIHPLALTNSSLRPGQDSVVSLSALYQRNRAQVAIFIEGPHREIIKRARKSKDNERATKDFMKALRVAAGIESSDDDLVNALADGYRNLYDKMLQYGQKTGELGPGLDDFVHVTINPEAANRNINFLVDSLAERYRKVYADTDPDTPLHRATLIRAGITDKEGNLNENLRLRSKEAGEPGSAGPSKITKIPTTRKDLEELTFVDKDGKADPAVRLYDERIKEVLPEHAKNAIHNKVNPAEGKSINDVAEEDASAGVPRRNERSDMDRRIEQDFFLQEDILDLGIVELDPTRNALAYMYNTGTRIARQDAVNRVTGRTDITFEGLVKMAERDLLQRTQGDINRDINVRSIIESLENTERDLSGRNVNVGEGETSAKIVSSLVRNISSIPVLAAIPIAMSSVEIPTSILSMGKFGKAGFATTVKTLARVVRDGNFSNEELRAAGKSFDFAVRETRHLAQTGFDDQSVTLTKRDRLTAAFRDVADTARGRRNPRSLPNVNNRSLATFASATEGLADLTRTLSFEEFLTNRGRAMTLHMHRAMTWEFLDKLEELSKRTNLAGDRKAIRAAAREIGIKPNLAEEFINFGLSGTDFIEGALILRNAGVKDVHNPAQVNKVLASLPDRVSREKAQEAFNKISDYAVAQTDKLIVNPSVWDRPSHSQHPIIQLVNTFLSFPRAFRSNRIRPLADQGAVSLAFWSSLYLTGEVVNRQLQAMVFEGKTPDEVITDWEENLDLVLAQALQSIPFMGPYQSSVFSVVSSVMTGDRLRLPGSPGLGITGSILRDIIDVFRSVVGAEDDVDIDVYKRLEKMVPGLNIALVQGAEEAISQSISEENNNSILRTD